MRWHQTLACWVTASHDSTIRMWSPDGTNTQLIRASAGVTAMCIDKNFGYVVAGSTDHLIRVYDPKHDMIVQVHTRCDPSLANTIERKMLVIRM